MYVGTLSLGSLTGGIKKLNSQVCYWKECREYVFCISCKLFTSEISFAFVRQ